eukprot:2327799-Pyramimonas_sp.AAC.1
MFEELMRNPALHKLLPFVRQWYGDVSQFRWRDAQNNVYAIPQGDGGEQGDALMPALFCMALQPALLHIRERLPPGAELVAYLDDIYL